ncbi:hypothetical protein CB1_002658001 [Camelus ferus]|nr:hypothetical protein CB1_002658001 [Camelus ferus]
MEGLLSPVELGFELILRELSAVLVSLLPDGLSSQFIFQSLQWETVLSLPSRMSVAGWVLCGILGCPPGLVVAAGSMITGQSPEWVSAMEGLLSSMELGFGLILRELSAVLVSLLPDGLSSHFMFQRLQWETVLSLPVLTSLIGVLFIYRFIRSVASHLCQRYEKQLAEKLAAQIKEKCHLIDQLYVAKQECARMETTLKNAGLEKEPVNVPSVANAYRQLMTVNLSSRKEISFLSEELRKERSLQSIQAEVAEMLKGRTFLEEVTRISTSQGAVTNQPGLDGDFPRSGPSY